jgi:hypothetical protein
MRKGAIRGWSLSYPVLITLRRDVFVSSTRVVMKKRPHGRSVRSTAKAGFTILPGARIARPWDAELVFGNRF